MTSIPVNQRGQRTDTGGKWQAAAHIHATKTFSCGSFIAPGGNSSVLLLSDAQACWYGMKLWQGVCCTLKQCG